MKKFFNLMELIITIVIISIIAVIVLLNITGLNEKAKITSLIADKKNIQLAADKYNLDRGFCPSDVQPKLGNPQPINFKLLYSDYIKSIPKHKDVYYWVDFQCVVYISLIDAPTDVSVDIPNGVITWTPHKDSSKSIIHIKKPNGSIKIVKEDSSGNYDGEDGKEHLVSEEDKYGLDTPPVGKDYIGYPEKPDGDNTEGNTPEGPIVPCDTNGFICIYTAEELASIGVAESHPIGENYRLANDIDLISFGNWTPIFNSEDWESFAGVFDGNGFSIDNLTSKNDGSNYLGLFSRTEHATVMNLTLNNVNIEGNSAAGGVSAQSNYTTLENISVNGKVKGDYNVGGIVGSGDRSFIKDVTFNGEVIGSHSQVGGIIGYAYHMKAINLKSYGSVEGIGYVAGIFGNAYYIEAANLSAQSNIISKNNYGGGLMGYSYESKYSNIHFKGNVYSTSYAGGLIGSASRVEINSSSAEGDINILNVENAYMNYYGGLIGYASGLKMVDSTYKGDVTVNIENGDHLYTGGIVGYLTDSDLSDISARSNISTLSGYVGGVGGYINASKLNYIKYIGNINAKGEYVGGLAGYIYSSNAHDSHIESKLINNSQYTGGLVGYSSGATYHRVYSNVSVNSIDNIYVNALFGYAYLNDNIEVPFKDIYWNSKLSNQSYSSVYYHRSVGVDVQTDINNHATGKHLSIEERKNKENYSDWDFNSVWEYENGLPKLRDKISSIDDSKFIADIWFKDCNVIFEGNGTESSPYKIKTHEDFKNMQYCVTSTFELVNDINIDGNKHNPIRGYKWDDFRGTIYGNNHTITATNLSKPLFEGTSNLTMKNIKFKDITMGLDVYDSHLISDWSNELTLDNIIFENVQMDVKSTMGIVSGNCYDCTISNITVKDSSLKTSANKQNGSSPSSGGGLFGNAIGGTYSGIDLINFSVDGGYMTGGIVGVINYYTQMDTPTTFENIKLSNVKIKGRNSYTGGLIGHGGYYEIKNVTGNVEVIGTSEVGGIIGESKNGIVSDIKMNTSDANIVVVATGNYIGGISGYMSNSSVSNVNITGNLTTSGRIIGGIYGYQIGTTKQNTLFNGKINNAIKTEN